MSLLCNDYYWITGFGGQTDFVYGSAAAIDGQGKSIIALPSRTEKGEPKIVPFLKEVRCAGWSKIIVTQGQDNVLFRQAYVTNQEG